MLNTIKFWAGIVLLSVIFFVAYVEGIFLGEIYGSKWIKQFKRYSK